MLAQIAGFLNDIGLPTSPEPVEVETVLPGVLIRGGELRYDEERLVSPGDLLHEAGHLALLSPAQRARCEGDVGSDGGLEMGAIAWSWAALTHLGIEPTVVFHEHGYYEGSDALVAAFRSGGGPGVPILVWRGLTTMADFPAMHRWLAELPWPE